MKRTLGLDLGTSSVGWAVVDVPEESDEVGAVLAMGSRIFHPGAEVRGSTVSTAAAERRLKRAMRRQIARRSKRRQLIRVELTRFGLLPTDDADFARLMDVDPYGLRDRSRSGEALSLREIGRVVYWMSSRRGFLSLRAGGSQVLEDEDDATRKRYRLTQFSASTGEVVIVGQEDDLVQFVLEQRRHHADLLDDHVLFGRRGRLAYPVRPIARSAFLSRGNLLDEFGLHGLVFFQRKVFWSQGSIGVCSADPGSRQQRAPRALRLSQAFSVWQVVCNLRIGPEKRALSPEERDQLVAVLSSQKSMSFSKIRSVLGLGDDEFVNFDRGDGGSLKGHETDAEMRRRLGAEWTSLDETSKDRVVELLAGSGTEDQIRSTLHSRFGLSDQAVEGALKTILPSGRMAYGRRALRRILPHLRSSASLRDALVAAGYRVPEEVRAESTVEVGSLTNPMVRTTLIQMGKVLDALEVRFARSGLPAFDVVRIELSRDVSSNKKRRDEISRQQRVNERDRALAKERVSEFAAGAENSGDAVRRFRLWAEQGEQCLYSGRMIPAAVVLSNQVQIDHILPQSKTLNNGMANVALVFTSENQAKGDRTVFEWGGHSKVEEVVDRARRLGLSRSKINNLSKEQVEADEIGSALLVQTGYVNSLARDLVAARLGVPVEVSRGRLTRQLLHQIGLRKDNSDHRRHGLDAAMVALTTPAVAQRLARSYKARRDGRSVGSEFGGWEPWEGCRNELEREFESLVVSHRVYGKHSGQLHEETNYGQVRSPYANGEVRQARRKGLAGGLSRTELTEVADPVVRAALVSNLIRRGLDPEGSKLVFSDDDPPKMPDGQVIRKVRLHKNLPGNRVIRPGRDPKTTVTLSRNHSAYVYRNTVTGRLRIHVETKLDAFLTRGVPASVKREQFRSAGEEFLWSLRPGDTLMSSSEAEPRLLVRVEAFEGDPGRRIAVRTTNSSDKSSPATRLSATALQRDGWTKVVVTPDGQLRRARD